MYNGYACMKNCVYKTPTFSTESQGLTEDQEEDKGIPEIEKKTKIPQGP